MYDGAVRQCVTALKYRNRRGAAVVLAHSLVARLGLRRSAFDIVTWAPTGAARVRSRGYDQAELLARAVARELGLPCRRLLYRGHGAPQTGRSRAERLHGPQFRARRGGPRVLLVDDVLTTGATLHAAQAALESAGAWRVTVVAAAATPASSGSPTPRSPRLHLAA